MNTLIELIDIPVKLTGKQLGNLFFDSPNINYDAQERHSQEEFDAITLDAQLFLESIGNPVDITPEMLAEDFLERC